MDDFVKRYPNGSDASVMKVPEWVALKPLRHFVPQHYSRALAVENYLMLAKMLGYSDHEIASMRQKLQPPLEPTLVSLDELYGEEAQT